MKLRVAYVTIFDATDIRNWSGTDLHVWKSLEAAGCEIRLIHKLQHGKSILRKLRRLWTDRVERREFIHFWDISTATGYARYVERQLAEMEADVVVSPTPVPLARLKTRHPKVLWTDATYAALRENYREFDPSLIGTCSARSAEKIDAGVSRNCDLLVFASQWGADRMVSVNGADPQKVRVIPYGANIEVPHGRGDVAQWAEERKYRPLRFLFVGVDWNRKGAAKAIEVVAAVNRRGVPATIDLVGCRPPEGYATPDFVNLHGFVAKSTPEGKALIERLYREASVLVVPTVAEAYGLVFAEASAFGVPSLSHAVGGVTTVVQNEVNGKLFGLDSPADAWAEHVVTEWVAKDRFGAMALSCYDRYCSDLNWRVAGARMKSELERLVPGRVGRSARHGDGVGPAHERPVEVLFK